MCSSAQPANGADSEQPGPWRVTLCDRFEPDIRFDVRIPNAYGKHDARNQAEYRHPGASFLKAEPVVEVTA
jgi:hypothetical protein